MDSVRSKCSVCSRGFEVRFRYQLHEGPVGFSYYCSQACQQSALGAEERHRCSVCEKEFALEYPYQIAVSDTETSYYCAPRCRDVGPALSKRHRRVPTRIAIFNHKGGTGKTTTSINVAAGLAEAGERVLLIDCDGQGNVGASLGIRGEHNLYHVIVDGADPAKAAVPVRKNLDVLTSNELLAAAELYLAQRPNRDRILRERLGERVRGYDVVILDCAPALSLMNQNVLVYADSVLLPVSCDYLSLVGVKQVLRTIKNVRDMLDHDIDLLGVVPTFYDARTRIGRDAVEALTKHFRDRCLPPIRVNTKLREAPRDKKTIFELAPDSHGAADYRVLVDKIRDMRSPTRASSVPPPSFLRDRSAPTITPTQTVRLT
jgi:chromosome partitioning protein